MPLYDVMLANTDPTVVAQQLDIGNMFAAGAIANGLYYEVSGQV